MFDSIPPFLYITLVIVAAVISLYTIVRSIRIKAHFSVKVMFITFFFMLTIAGIRKFISSYLWNFSEYLDILDTIHLVLFVIALVMMFKFGDEKRKGLTIIALIFVILFFGLYFYLTLFYKG